jgi:hypothetical protein
MNSLAEELVPEPVPEPAPDPVPELLPKPVPELLPEPALELVPELLPKPVPELLPEPAPDLAAELLPGLVLELAPEPAVAGEMAEVRAAAREQASRDIESRTLYNTTRAHDLAAGFSNELHFDRMQLAHLQQRQQGIRDKRARLEPGEWGGFESMRDIRPRYRMPQALIRRMGDFTAEHVELINQDPWRRLEKLNKKLGAADAEIERLERAIEATKAEYAELVHK